MKNGTRQTGERTVICARPTLQTLAWASGQVLMSNPGFGNLVATLDRFISIQINKVSFSSIRPVIDDKFRHNIVQVVVDPRGDSQVDSQATLTMF